MAALPGFCHALWPMQRNVSEAQYGTRSPSDCERDDSGLLPYDGSATLCAVRCLACARCRYVSYSSDAGICAWYSHCDLQQLRNWWSARVRPRTTLWNTSQVREFIPAPLPPAASLEAPGAVPQTPFRLAIATLSLVAGARRRGMAAKRGGRTTSAAAATATKQGCGLLGWCLGVRRLKRALLRANPTWEVETLILHGPISARWSVQLPPPDLTDCPEARVVRVDAKLKQLVARCLMVGRKRQGRWRSRPFFTGMPSGILFKWQLMSWYEYDAVVRACPLSIREHQHLISIHSHTTLTRHDKHGSIEVLHAHLTALSFAHHLAPYLALSACMTVPRGHRRRRDAARG